jgi:tetratricopeptide (TPR) repeat protein
VLGALSYVEAVVWLGARLADGLAHAHDRGILHRDMKPANILLTDDGRPMLLDFNLAEDLKLRGGDGATEAGIGGTLPYMAPEHLAAFGDGGAAVDARSDLYAVGVILFEMLTGRPPFPVREGTRPDSIRALIADRQGPPPRLAPWNRAVSPAVESIVRRCLEPDPGRRYRSARELGEDLRRHLAHRPLAHAPDPSRRERVAKWLRRNRRPVTAAAVLAVALAVVGGFALAMGARSDQLARFKARAALDRFREHATSAMNLLNTWSEADDAGRRREGLAAARQALDEFHALSDPDPTSAAASPWWDRDPAARLGEAERARLRDEAGELLLLLAGDGANEALAASDPAARQLLLRVALRDNRRAERCFEPDSAPWSLWSQQAVLLKALGDVAGARQASARAAASPLTSARDYFLAGSDLARRGLFAEAVPRLESAVGLDPDLYWAWLTAGNCHNRLLQDAQASACFNTCIALWPGHPAAWHNRGVIMMRQGKLDQAAADFDRALALRPDAADVVTNRALVALKKGQPAEAILGFDRALALGGAPTRVYLMRAQARALLGDSEGARRDHDEAMRREPTDEVSWVSRALARSKQGDDLGALADLDRALALNPKSALALENKAYVLAERLGKTAEAVAALDQFLALAPDDAAGLASRAVLLARLGRRDAALADAEGALERDHTPFRHYKVAGVFALTSRQAPDDRATALRLLASALRRDTGLVRLVDKDHELDPVRDDPGFLRIVSKARADAPPPTPSGTSPPAP